MIVNSKNMRPVIGILTHSEVHKELYDYCAIAASFYNCETFYFSKNNIETEKNLIQGKTFQNGKWIRKDYSLKDGVDVIYDRLRTSSFQKHKEIYEKVKHIPTTHPNFGGKMNKLTFYDNFYNEGSLLRNIIPYEKFKTAEDTLEFLMKYKNIILKPQSSSGGKNLYFIQKKKRGFEVALEQSSKLYTLEELNIWLNELPNSTSYVLQKFIPSKTLDNRPFDIRVHMIRNNNNKWQFLAITPRIGHDIAKISMLSNGGYIGEWSGFIKRNFGKNSYHRINKNIKSISIESVDIMEKVFDSKITEVGIDFVIDKDESIYFVEYNVNKPAGFYSGFDLALHGIGYAKYVAENTTDEDYLDYKN